MKQASKYHSALARGRRGPCRSGDAACAPRAPSFASKHRHCRPHHRACAANVTVDGTRCFYKKMHACIVHDRRVQSQVLARRSHIVVRGFCGRLIMMCEYRHRLLCFAALPSPSTRRRKG